MSDFYAWNRNRLLGSLKTPKRRVTRWRKPVQRPTLELLEDRTLLSTWYVNSLATGSNNGQSWANAYTNLQSALTSSQLHSGDQIWVAQGTYKPTSGTNRESSFDLKDGVEVYGGFAGTETQLGQRDWVQHVTTLSGDIGVPGDSSDNSYEVVSTLSLTATARLDGFTITAGNAEGFNGDFFVPAGGMGNGYDSSPTLTNLIFSSNTGRYGAGGMVNEYGSSPTLTNVTFNSNSATDGAGGMYNYDSSPTLTNVTFSSNTGGRYGGGMYNDNSSSPTLTNVTFSSNSATDGGGVYNYSSSPTLTNVTFYSNHAAYYGGGMYNNNSSSPTLTNVTFSSNYSAYYGGGMYNNSSSPTLTNVTFSSNSTTYNGGGGLVNLSSSPTLTNVTFSSNSAGAGGGGMENFSSSPTLTNVTFSSNSAGTIGGGMFNGESSPTLTNVTFNRNSGYGAGMYNESSSPTLANSILWGDSGVEIINDFSSATVSYSDVQGGLSGYGIIDAGNNINADPLFVDAAQGDLHLKRGSPAIDTGTNRGAPLFDRDNNPRPIDGGSGQAITDMGAYEFRPILYVNAAATAGGDGTSWGTAYTDLQQALAAAQATEAIWVAQGTYKPTSGTNRESSFDLKDGVEVYGGFAGTETQLGQRDWVQHVTTLSGDIGVPGDSSDNSYEVVSTLSLTATARLDGFTITAGNAEGFNGDFFVPAGGMGNGYDSSPTLTNLIFSSNTGRYGAGGMVNEYGSSPTLTNVTFNSNSATDGAGGMYNYDSSPTLTNVTFSSNTGGRYGGGMYNDNSSSPTLTNVTFYSNSATDGGGVYNYSSSPTLTNVTFYSNHAAYNGGGLVNLSSSPTLTNVTFSSNSAGAGGGGLVNLSSSPTLTNVTFSSNSAGTTAEAWSTPPVRRR